MWRFGMFLKSLTIIAFCGISSIHAAEEDDLRDHMWGVVPVTVSGADYQMRVYEIGETRELRGQIFDIIRDGELVSARKEFRRADVAQRTAQSRAVRGVASLLREARKIAENPDIGAYVGLLYGSESVLDRVHPLGFTIFYEDGGVGAHESLFIMRPSRQSGPLSAAFAEAVGRFKGESPLA